MKLFLNCSNCRETFKFKSSSITRPDLEMELGEYFKKQCTHCLITKEYHVNDSYAKSSSSKMGNLLGMLIIIISTTYLWNMGVVSNAGVILGGAIMIGSNYSRFTSNTSAFNKYRITRTEKP